MQVANSHQQSSWRDLLTLFAENGPDVVTAIAACAGVWIAHRGLTEWKRQTIGQRKIELAEQVLSDFRLMRDVIDEIRNPLIRPGEITDSVGFRGQALPILARIDSFRDTISEFLAKRYRAQAYFGPEIEAAYAGLEKVIVNVKVAAGQLSQAHEISTSDEEVRRMKAQLLGKGWPGDPLKPDIEKAVGIAEHVCGEWLSTTVD